MHAQRVISGTTSTACERHRRVRTSFSAAEFPLRRRRQRETWVGIHLDITERERSAEQRIEQARNIARFNAELEQFAYVSAHDLQEPLRMISSYVQLLSRRYKGKLDADADTYIGYAVEGAERLQNLLQDLLELQQVGKRNKPIRDRATCQRS